MKTVLHVEDLLEILDWNAMTVAGYSGSCERVVRYDAVVAGLKTLIEKANSLETEGKPE